LGVHAKILLLVQLNPDTESYFETISTLKFAKPVNDHMDDSNDDNMGNYHQLNVEDNNLKDSIKQATKTPMFKSGASRNSKLACKLILLEIKSLFGWSDKRFTTLLK